VFAPEYSNAVIGTLLTLPGRELPLVPPPNESAAAVLLPVSACNVVVVGEDPPPEPPPGPLPVDGGDAGLECCPEPHARDAARKSKTMISKQTESASLGLQHMAETPRHRIAGTEREAASVPVQRNERQFRNVRWQLGNAMRVLATVFAGSCSSGQSTGQDYTGLDDVISPAIPEKSAHRPVRILDSH
jgi:hypothetical protein